ncbi:MAG TPA: HAD family hydrolase, partial [Acidimicrobiales bacterium]
MPVRLFASDLDGTLLRRDGTISERTRAAVDAAEAKGIGLVVATGRPPRWIPPVVEQLGERGLVVCANGALVYDPARHELVERFELDGAAVAEAAARVRAAVPKVGMAVERGFEFAIDDRYHELAQISGFVWDGPLEVGPIESFCDGPITKMLVRIEDPAPDGFVDEVRSLVAGLADVTHSMSESFLELSRPGVHKASTVEHVIAESGVAAADVVAFGDMPNDLELLRWAGLGVAVANAH